MRAGKSFNEFYSLLRRYENKDLIVKYKNDTTDI